MLAYSKIVSLMQKESTGLMARETGLNQATISLIKNGKVPNPRLSTVESLDKFFKDRINEYYE